MANGHGGKREGSGRKKGSTESRTEMMLELMRSHPLTKDYDPISTLAVCANGQLPQTFEAFQEVLAELRKIKKPTQPVNKAIAICISMLERPVFSNADIIAASKELSQYAYPKLRAMEISDPEGKNPFAGLASALIMMQNNKGE